MCYGPDTGRQRSERRGGGPSTVRGPGGEQRTRRPRRGATLVDGSGSPLHLKGVNATGTETACNVGDGFSYGPLDAAEAQAMTTWNINVVRVPLHEHCWLGINGMPEDYAGANYRNAMVSWVDLLNEAGIVAILDLHVTAPGSNPVTFRDHWGMPDADHAPDFWTSVARTFRSNPSVIFDLYNEPVIGGGTPSDEDWQCWRDGCDHSVTMDGVTHTFAAVGIQDLVTTVRETGATQPILIEGLEGAGDPCSVVDSAPLTSASRSPTSRPTRWTSSCSTRTTTPIPPGGPPRAGTPCTRPRPRRACP